MQRIEQPTLKREYSPLIASLLHFLTQDASEMSAVKDALFNRPLVGSPGQTHVHLRKGFAVIDGTYLHYDIEFVITSHELQHVGATVKKLLIYDNLKQYVDACNKVKNEEALTGLDNFMKAVRKHFG